MAGQDDTLNQTTSGDSSGSPGTPPGQQQGSQEQDGQQTPPSTTGTAPGQQSGSSEGDDANYMRVSKTDMEERIGKAKRSGQRDVLKDLGFLNVDSPEGLEAAQQELRKDLEYARTERQAKMTAEEKVREQIKTLNDQITAGKAREEKLKKDLETAQDAQTKAELDLDAFRRQAVVVSVANEAIHPTDVVSWAEVHKPDLLAAVLKDDGSPDEAAAKKVVEACKQVRPEYFSRTLALGSPANRGAKPPSGASSQQSEETQTTETARW